MPRQWSPGGQGRYAALGDNRAIADPPGFQPVTPDDPDLSFRRPARTTREGAVLVCLMVDAQATALMALALELTADARDRCRVLVLDTPTARHAGARVRAGTQQALQQAEALGIKVVRVSLGIDSPMHVISTIIQQAKANAAGQVIVGGQSMLRRHWPGFGERVADFAEVLASSLPQTDVHVVMPRQGRVQAAVPPARNGVAGLPWRRTLAEMTLVPLATMLACTAVSAVLAPWLHPINLTLIFLLGQVFVALRCSVRASLFMLVGSMLIYDGIFVEPRWSLKPTDPQYLFTLAVALLVGVAVSRLASHSRETAQRALALADRSQSLSLLAQHLARARTEADIVDAVSVATQRGVVGATRVRWQRDGGGDDEVPSGGGQVLRFPIRVMAQAMGELQVSGPVAEACSAEDLHLLQSFAHQMAMAIERLRFEERSAQAAVEAESERVRNTLLAGISHDFRTPLTTIIGATTAVLTQGELISMDQRNALARSVLEQAQRLQSLTSDLLDLARLQEGAVKPELEWCPFDELVHEALVSAGPALREHHVLVQAQGDELVWCDVRLVTQVLVNLLINAAQHAPAGTQVTVAVALAAPQWTLVVRDQGPGLEPGREQDVFKKFHRERHARSSEGTGLGLAICAAVAQLHGASIHAYSEGGAVFRMVFPLPSTHQTLPEDT